jgi:Family of unknown function (DUF6272)
MEGLSRSAMAPAVGRALARRSERIGHGGPNVAHSRVVPLRATHMLAQELLDIRVALRRRGIIFAYCGFVTEAVLSGLGEALKQKLTIEDASTKTMRSVFAVFVEQMQNIIRYSEERLPPDAPDAMRYGLLTIAQDGGDYVVYSGNVIRADDVLRMRQSLEEIMALDKGALRTRYKERLRSDQALRRGAGIGLIEIARRASKLEFDFVAIDEQTAFFALKASI